MNTAELENKHPNDIAERIAELSEDEQAIAFLLLPGHLEGEVFTYFDRPTQEHILKSLGNSQMGTLLRSMQPDDRTRLFEDFPDSLIKDAVNLLDEPERKIALTLIGYPEESVGRMMTPYYIQVRPGWTVQETLLHIKKHGRRAEMLDWILSGLALGSILGTIGFVRIFIWQRSGFYDYGEHWFFVALTVATALIGIVLWGTLSGSMIPFLLRRFRLDPATSSAPFVATLVDVTGLIIYFSIAAVFLNGKML